MLYWPVQFVGGGWGDDQAWDRGIGSWSSVVGKVTRDMMMTLGVGFVERWRGAGGAMHIRGGGNLAIGRCKW